MDREEDWIEKINTYKSSSSNTPIPTTTSILVPTTTTLNATHDIDTSSAESLESWTIINDRNKKKIHDGSDNHIEILKNSDTEKENGDVDVEEVKDIDHDLKDEEDKLDHNVQMKVSTTEFSCGDLSDNISVVSESEILHKESQIRRRYQSTENGDEEIKFRIVSHDCYGSLLPQTPFSHVLEEVTKSLVRYSLCITKRGVKCALYVAFGIAILGLLGNLYSYTGLTTVVNPLASISELQDKVNKVEIENNLLRAEIDLIYKQVKHLSKLNEQHKSEKNKGGKTFKAWSGNGASLKPVDITKEDLKKPFKCPDGSFVEIANMCMEQQAAKEPSIVDQFGEVVEILNEESASVSESNNGNYNIGKIDSHERKKEKYGRQGSSEKFSTTYNKRKNYKNVDSGENRKGWPHNVEDDSDEWRFDYMKNKERKRKRSEYKKNSGEWHENYMKNREHLRKDTEKRAKEYNNFKYV